MPEESETIMALNEADLQARLTAQIRQALPMLPTEIRLERYLQLRLGHKELTIDGGHEDKGTVRGRYDVLVLVGATPLVLAELKAPNVDLEEDDISQGLSYARLHEPMVPLVLVTNGVKTILRRTYDGATLDPTDIAADRLQAVLASATAVAAAASEGAIRTLLGTSPEVWTPFLLEWTTATLEKLTGEPRHFRRPLTRDFAITRAMTGAITADLALNHRVLVVHGPPLSGVTNVLAQVSRSPGRLPALLIDANQHPDILQSIANRLTRHLLFGVTKDDVRNWLNTRKGLVDLVLVVDGVPNVGLEELVDHASAGILKLVLGMNTETFRKHATLAGRSQESVLGSDAKAMELAPLSNGEFEHALELIDRNFSAFFYNGAQHVPHLRWPRSLRMIVATLPKVVVRSAPGDRETASLLPPIQGPTTLSGFSDAFSTDAAVRFDLQQLAKVYLEDVALHLVDRDWVAATWGTPSIDPALLEAGLGAERIARLREQGYLSWVDSRGIGPRVLVAVEELLAHHVAEEWKRSLLEALKAGDLVAELDRLLLVAGVLPRGEVALAAAIRRAETADEHVLGVLVSALGNREPTTMRLTEGARVDALFTDVRIRMIFGEGMDEEVVGNVQPWIVLSYLAEYPMQADGDDHTANFAIFARLGQRTV